MTHSIGWTAAFGMVMTACASTPGARPHDMSATRHDAEAARHTQEASRHASRHNPAAQQVYQPGCLARVGGGRIGVDYSDICWSSFANPTEGHLRQAEEHRRHAADHREASAALRQAEAQACVGLGATDRDLSPFVHVGDIVAVAPLAAMDSDILAVPRERLVGATVTFRAVEGLTAEWLQRLVDCHLARNAALGHDVPDMSDCPLVPKGVEARVRSTGSGFAIDLRAADHSIAAEVLARSRRLLRGPVSSAPTSAR